MAKTRRGRKPKESAVDKATAINATSIPAAPKDLGQYGIEYWNALAPQLIEMGILRPMHVDTFRVLCETWQEYRQLTLWLSEDPSRMTFTTAKGYVGETPQVRQRDKALASLQKLWLKFGLTPHALAQLVKQKGCNIGNALPAIAEFAKRKYSE